MALIFSGSDEEVGRGGGEVVVGAGVVMAGERAGSGNDVLSMQDYAG